jgi:hypothetical protein
MQSTINLINGGGGQRLVQVFAVVSLHIQHLHSRLINISLTEKYSQF